MNRKSKIIILLVIAISVVGIVGYNYVMHGGERNLSTEKTVFEVTSKSITTEFATNIEVSNKKYLEKAIAVKGIVSKITGKEIIIGNSVICNLKESDASIKKNQVITIKGRVVGYDDLMSELKLDQCFKAL